MDNASRALCSGLAVFSVATALLVAGCSSSAPGSAAAASTVTGSSSASSIGTAPRPTRASSAQVSASAFTAATSWSGSRGSSPESSTPGGTDTKSGAASSGTQIIHVKPTDGHGNLLPRYSAGTPVEELTVPGIPSITPSPFGGSAYAINAAVAGSSLNDCWPAAQPHKAVCLFNPDDTTVTPISVAEDLPIIDPVADLSPEVRPWQIELDDGLVCGARTHGSTTFRETYQCMDPATGSDDEIKSTVSNVDTAASVWTIQQVNAPSLDAIPDRDNPPTRTAQIVTAWFNG